MKCYRKIIYGATCYGIGAACRSGRDTLILEPGIHPGGEFADTFNPGRFWTSPLRTVQARAFRSDLEERGALDGKTFHLPALIPALCRFILDKGLEIRLNHSVISVVPDGLNLRVRAAAPEGEREFLTASFTDTWSLPEGKLTGKSLNATVRACGDAASPEIAGFMAGAFPGEGYFRFPVAGDCTYPDARFQLEQFWRNRPAEAADWSITGTAMRFELKAGKNAEKISPRHIRMFSGSFNHAAAALDAGFSGEVEL